MNKRTKLNNKDQRVRCHCVLCFCADFVLLQGALLTVASCVPVTQRPHITALLSYVRIIILITLLLNIKDFSQLVTLRIWHKVAKQWKPLLIY